MLFGGGLPKGPSPRKNSFLGRLLGNKELEQILKSQTLQTDIIKQFDEGQKVQQDFIVRQTTANQRMKTILAELEAREIISTSKAEESVLSAMEKKLEMQLKRKKIQGILDELENR